MKTCPQCGRAYADEASFCAADGRPLQSPALPPLAPPSAAADRQRKDDTERLQVLAILHFVIAALAFCGIGFLFLHYMILHSVFSNPRFLKAQPDTLPLPMNFFAFFVWIYVVIGVFIAIGGVLNALSGLFLLQRKNRVFSMVVAILNCFQIPFGTILGIFTIITLSDDSTRRLYGPRP